MGRGETMKPLCLFPALSIKAFPVPDPEEFNLSAVLTLPTRRCRESVVPSPSFGGPLCHAAGGTGGALSAADAVVGAAAL